MFKNMEKENKMEKLKNFIVSFVTFEWLRWFWTDDKTGEHSDTTLRTNVMYLIFYVVLIVSVIRTLLSDAPLDIYIRSVIDLLTYISIATGGQGLLYLGKRWTEMKGGSI